jgi:hypothetical protein
MTMALAGDNRCPVCRAALGAPDIETLGPKTCPRCGAELWALVGSGGPLFFPRRPGESELGFLASLAGPLCGTSAEQMEAVLRSADRLDMVEIILDVEDAMRSGHC